MKVLKFGGTSVATPGSIRKVKAIVESQQEPVVVVVSALGGVTDELVRIAALAEAADPAYLDGLAALRARHITMCEELLGAAQAAALRTSVEALLDDLYGKDADAIRADISGATYSDAEIAETVRDCYARTGYLLDPHGACGYRALKEGLRPGETGFFCETAHPAKFKETVERIIGAPVAIPPPLAAFMHGKKQSVPLPRAFSSFKEFLLSS